MNEAGNHGGSSSGEMSTALIFISPEFANNLEAAESPLPAKDEFLYYDLVEQTDIAPTLAALLGFPVPRNNLGTVIPRVLEFWRNGGHDFMSAIPQG